MGGNLATADKQGKVTLRELLVSSLAQVDPLAKQVIEKGLITKDEFMQKLSDERAVYQAMLQKMRYAKWQSHANGSATYQFPRHSIGEWIG